MHLGPVWRNSNHPGTGDRVAVGKGVAGFCPALQQLTNLVEKRFFSVQPRRSEPKLN
jgi:hypothetical protein